MLLFSLAITGDSLTYIPFILLTKSYVSLFGIVAGFVQIWAIVQLLIWKKIGVLFLVLTMVVVFVVTAVNEFYLVSNVSQIIIIVHLPIELRILASFADFHFKNIHMFCE